jgi:acetyl-CoA C-acetyltransferase
MSPQHRRIWGQTPREALAESGALWSTYARVASKNPNSWLKRRFEFAEITTPSPDNRLIAWPYTKLMVANPTVNMGAALLLTSLGKARAAGIGEERLVFPLGGAAAEEPRDDLLRDQFYESHPQNAVLEKVMGFAGDYGQKFDAIELYSCFPCVPKMARRTLGLNADVQPTVTGGLTFFGAPLNSYMTHAACAMVRRLRSGAMLGLSTARAALSPSIMPWSSRAGQARGAFARFERAGGRRSQQARGAAVRDRCRWQRQG